MAVRKGHPSRASCLIPIFRNSTRRGSILIGNTPSPPPPAPSFCDIPSVWAWWDPEQDVTLVTAPPANAPQYWDDQCAARRATFNTGYGSRTGLTTRNGRNVIDFNGYMDISFPLGTDQFAIFMVVEVDNVNEVGYFANYDASRNGSFSIFRPNLNTYGAVRAGGSAAFLANTLKNGPQPFEAVSATWNRSTYAWQINNVEQKNVAAVDATSITDWGLQFGTYAAGGVGPYSLVGPVGDIVIMKAPTIAPADIAAVWSILQTRWGL